MAKNKKKNVILAILLQLVILGCLVAFTYKVKNGSIKNEMRDAVLHQENKISLFGLMNVDPSLISAFIEQFFYWYLQQSFVSFLFLDSNMYLENSRC